MGKNFRLQFFCLSKAMFPVANHSFFHVCSRENCIDVMRGPRKFCPFFMFDEVRKDPNTTISRPSTTRQRKVILRFAGGPMMAQH